MSIPLYFGAHTYPQSKRRNNRREVIGITAFCALAWDLQTIDFAIPGYFGLVCDRSFLPFSGSGSFYR